MPRRRSPLPPAPRQERSRRTLEAVLTATEALLAERLFEDLSMADIAKRAGVAVGTIYTRFRAKEDLLPVLFERHHAGVAATVGALLGDLERRPSLKGRVERVVAFAVDYHVEHRGLLRALTHYVRAHPEDVPAQAFTSRADEYRAVAEIVVGTGEEVRRRDAVGAAEFALSVVNSVCREQVLFGEASPLGAGRASLQSPKGRARLVQRLADMVLRDLTA